MLVLSCLKNEKDRDFPGGPVVTTPYSQHRGHKVPPLVGELRSCVSCFGGPKAQPKKKKKTHLSIKRRSINVINTAKAKEDFLLHSKGLKESETE